jgi:hypothetical protein
MPPTTSTASSRTTPSMSSVEPLAVKPADAWRMLGCGNTRGYQLLRAGELISFLDGTSRKILTESIRNYIARQLAADRGEFQHDRLPPKHKRTKGVTVSTKRRK